MNIYSSISWVDIVSLLVLPVVLPALTGRIANVTTWPELAKRLTLGALSLVGVVLTNIVDAVTTGTPTDIGMLVLQFVATWIAGEVAYKKILKASIDKPIDARETNLVTALEAEPVDLNNYTAAELKDMITAQGGDYPKTAKKADLTSILHSLLPVLTDGATPATRSLASLIQRK